MTSFDLFPGTTIISSFFKWRAVIAVSIFPEMGELLLNSLSKYISAEGPEKI